MGLVAPHDAKMPKKGTPPRLRLGPCAREPRPGPRWAARPGSEASTGGSLCRLCPMLSVAAAAPSGGQARCSRGRSSPLLAALRSSSRTARPDTQARCLPWRPRPPSRAAAGVENTHDGKAKSSDAKQSRPTERSGTHAGRGHLGSGVSTGNATLRWYGPTPVAQSDWPRDTSAKYRGPTP